MLYLDHAKFVAPGRTDRFFKWLDEDEFVSTNGNVEAPTGWFGLLNLTREKIAEWVATDGDPWMSERRNFEPGWYIVNVNNDGLVWAHGYGEDVTFNEEGARADYATLEARYSRWDTDFDTWPDAEYED